MVPLPQVTIVHRTLPSGSFLSRVKSLSGSLAHDAGSDETVRIARSSLRTASLPAAFFLPFFFTLPFRLLALTSRTSCRRFR